ncbi:GNAT family N-acetyltransferase [Nocardioides zeae]|uniref:GNAT family N-acetyltransferase n=1 Tax=Nocardioides imazamoxiresistens TaxID=3231893 RepID=A0ABU3PTZ6_9ACTN|nr:GNAT family N-acetyltransferase [Nocardioides zeae]MDT9592669.1 GNAT family N-acetyltransferase [Nocardioides zeae]
MAVEDLDVVVRLHRRAFPDNVVGRFGGALLERYYRSFVTSPEAVATVATDDEGAPVGYLVGVLATDHHRRWVREHHLRALLAAALPALLQHPVLAAGLLRRRLVVRLRALAGRLRPRAAGGTVVEVAPTVDGSSVARVRPGPVAVLSHVAVEPGARGGGAGSSLIDHFEQVAERRGAARMCLATAEDGGAGALYERRGWRLQARRRTFDGRHLRIYERTVGGTSR